MLIQLKPKEALILMLNTAESAPLFVCTLIAG